MEYALAVFDVGMTNKKLVIYDDRLRQLDAAYRVFEPLVSGGVEAHDLAAIEAWLLESLAAFAARYPIKALAVTTHGATLVCLGEDGSPCAPCVLYTHDPGDDFQDRFYRLAGDPKELQAVTGTPAFKALINPSKGLLFLKERFPEDFAKTRLILNYPQYWGFRLTGKAGAEATYVGCHSYLWDFVAGKPSEVSRRLGVEGMLPLEMRESWDVLGTLSPEVARRTGLPADLVVTMGIHDSNASLLPYLAKQGDRDFVLDSTGSWCVIMHPQKAYGFAPEELGKVVFFNQSAMRTPVKTAIFTGGLEYEAWSKLFGLPAPAFDPDVYRRVIAGNSIFILPEIVRGSGQFPGSTARAVEDGKAFGFEEMRSGGARPAFLSKAAEAYAALNLSLAIQTGVAAGRAGLAPGSDFFIEGGFRKNEDYVALVQALVPSSRTALTGIAEATSLGAAMTAKAGLTGARLDELARDFEIEVSEAPKVSLPGLDKYREAFLRLVASGPESKTGRGPRP
jgi:sugar (pentulose or hexulose) kinase